MPLCFIEPQNAIRVIAESVGREARRQILIDCYAPPDLEPLIRAFVERVKPRRGFAIG